MGAQTSGAVRWRCACALSASDTIQRADARLIASGTPDAGRPLMPGVLGDVLATGPGEGRDVCRRRDRQADSYQPGAAHDEHLLTR
jgi:hypothetical protein